MALGKAAPTSIRVKGASAHVTYEEAGSKTTMLLRREGGTWKVSGYAALPSASKQEKGSES